MESTNAKLRDANIHTYIAEKYCNAVIRSVITRRDATLLIEKGLHFSLLRSDTLVIAEARDPNRFLIPF